MNSVKIFIESGINSPRNNSSAVKKSKQGSMEEVTQMINSCRLCLENQQNVYLFGEMRDEITYCAIATDLLKIDIKRDDSFPKHICLNCASLLTIFDTFKKKCRASWATLCETILPLRSFSTTEEVMLKEELYREDNDTTSKSIEHKEESFEDDDRGLNTDYSSDEEVIKVPLNQYKIEKSDDFVLNKRSSEQQRPWTRKKQHKKNFQCEVCGKIFRYESAYIEHGTVHQSFKQFECDICKKRFTRKCHVGTHMMIHTDIRPFPCDICGHAFRKRNNLAMHKVIHFDDFNFTCEQCDKKFKRKSDLTAHKKSHTGVKPYKCKKCGKKYASSSGLRKHVQKELCFVGDVENFLETKLSIETQDHSTFY